MTAIATVPSTEPKRMIWVKFSVEGFHCYPDAPEEVAYLRSRHRHTFNFRVSVQVWKDDRDLEFHMTKAWLKRQFQDGPLEAENRSCEMLANDLHHLMTCEERFRGRAIWIEVDEDGECGCFMRYAAKEPRP